MTPDSDAPNAPARPHVVIVGGGIAGLSCAWALAHPRLARDRSARNVRPRITVLEADAELGGKIRTTEFAGLPVDTGPDAFLARLPWATRLCHDLGIADELDGPSETAAYLWSKGRLRRFPHRTVLGIPSSLSALLLSRTVGVPGVARAALDLVLPAAVGRRTPDPTVADLVGARLGREVVDRLVDPLVGGINAGSADHLSVTAAAPHLAEVADANRSLMRGAGEVIRRRDVDQADLPTFFTPRTGMARVVSALEDRLGAEGVTLRTKAPVTGLEQTAGGWIVHIDGEAPTTADAVVLATPAQATAPLLAGVAPAAAERLSEIEYASVAIVRLAYTQTALTHPLQGSGFVVPAVDGRLLTACSWASAKWGHLRSTGQAVLRASVGRRGDTRFESMSDRELISAVDEEIATSLGTTAPPFAADVTRWPASFPQYTAGHDDRVLEIERAVAALPGLALAGAAYRGLGIPACIRSGESAAEQVLARLAVASRPPS